MDVKQEFRKSSTKKLQDGDLTDDVGAHQPCTDMQT